LLEQASFRLDDDISSELERVRVKRFLRFFSKTKRRICAREESTYTLQPALNTAPGL